MKFNLHKIAILSLLLSSWSYTAAQKVFTCRIVDYGSDMGYGYYNNTANTTQTTYKEDVDGDGLNTDDCISFWAYKTEANPSSPLSSTAITYETQAPSARFYGGLTAYYNKTGIGFTEGMINTNHELRDDWNMMSVHTSSGLMEKTYGFWFWDKADFLNGGNSNTVTFDANSSISVSNFRLSTNVAECRWVVRDGTQFYISESKFGTTTLSGQNPTVTKYSVQTLSPTTTKWALYSPGAGGVPYAIRFNSKTAVFEDHTFTDVTAVGFYAGRDSLFAGNTQLKWHAFEVVANVTRTDKPSFYTEMVEIPSSGILTSPFYISKTEIDYQLWKKVYRWAVSNQYCQINNNSGYVFDRDGDMGSMDVNNYPHQASEPVTDMSWYDAVLWCNALSEMEGLSPCYYSDAAKSKILRTIKDRTDTSKYNTKFDIYVDYTKNGYRLPTLAEWNGALGTAVNGTISGGTTTPVGSTTANNFGLFDMLGNVWEYCWDTPSAADSFNSTTQTNHIVLGGAFTGTDNDPVNPVKKWGDIPSKGNPNIGFRIIRADNGAIPPANQDYTSTPNWTISDNIKILPTTTPAKIDNIMSADIVKISGNKTYKTAGDPLYENDNSGFIRTDDAVVTVTPFYMSKYETSYEKWREIYNWAEIIGGYTFDGDGDMGCMDYRVGELTHDVTEPVTDPNWNDVMLWCNALSEYEGKTPVYYADTARTKILRKGLQWRIGMEQRYSGYPTYTNNNNNIRYEMDGYRLPTNCEWEVAYRSGLETKAIAGIYPTSIGTSKNLSNSDNHTWSVTTGTANSLGIYNLHGNVSEYTTGVQSYSYYLSHNPKDDDNEGLFGLSVRGGNFGSDYQLIKDYYSEKATAERIWIGFRPVRCDADEHPVYDVFVPDIKIKYDTTTYNPLTGQTFRNNLKRTGEFNKTGVTVPSITSKWIFTTSGAVSSSPVVVNNTLYIGSDDYNIYAIDATTGSQKWKYTTGNFVRSSATILNDTLFIGSNDGYLYCLNATSGTLIWKKKAYTSGAVKASPTVLYNTVFATWHGMFEVTNTVGLDTKTGQTEKWRYRRVRSNEGAICADSVHLYFPSSDNVIETADIATEQTIFYKTGDHNKGSMVELDKDRVLYAKETAIGAYYKNSGVASWLVNVNNGADQDLSPLSSPAVATVTLNGVPTKVVVFATLKNSIMLIDANGNVLWHRKDFTSPFNSAPVVSNNVIYVGSDDNKFYALNVSDGTTIWTYTTSGTIQCSPWVDNGSVYFSSNDGKVYAIKADTLSAVKNANSNSFKIYPSIASDYVNLSSSNSIEYVKVLNASGQIVQIPTNNKQHNRINVSSLPAGVYHLEAYIRNELIGTAEFIKQ